MLVQIKAELFRIRSMGYSSYYLGALMIFMSIYLFFNAGTNINYPLSISLMTFSQKGYAGMLILVMLIIALLGNKYQNRTYYYEIMNGTDIHTIIISKVLAYAFYVSIIFIIPNIIFGTFIAIRNGLGECENLGLPVVLFCIITIRFVIEAVLVIMMVRRVFVAGTIVYLLSMIGVGITTIIGGLMEVSNNVMTILLDCSTYVQVMKIFQQEYTASFIFTVLGSFVLEAILLYVLTVFSYRRKCFR